METKDLKQILKEADMPMNGQSENITFEQGLEAVSTLTEKKLKHSNYTNDDVKSEVEKNRTYFNQPAGDGLTPPGIALMRTYHRMERMYESTNF